MEKLDPATFHSYFIHIACSCRPWNFCTPLRVLIIIPQYATTLIHNTLIQISKKDLSKQWRIINEVLQRGS